jgi:hypothetical protein
MSREALKEYQQLSLRLVVLAEDQDDEIDKVTSRMDDLWREMSEEECSEAESFICEYANVVAKEVEALRKENEEYKTSFELYWRGTQALHKMYPHPDPLTWRDLGQTCSMAAEEARLSREAIEETLKLLGNIRRNHAPVDEGVDEAFKKLKAVASKEMMDRLEYYAWKPDPRWTHKGQYWFLYLEPERHAAYIYETSAYHNEKVWSGKIEGSSCDFQEPTRLDAMKFVEMMLEVK